MVRVQAPAKLNLGLRIVGRRPDGYHLIETVFVPLRLFDGVEVEPGGSGIHLETDDPDLPRGRENLAVRAAEDVCAALGIESRHRIWIEKRIPVAAGLGGGSSDAAAVLMALEALAGRVLPAGLRGSLALGLGADVPFFLDPRPAIGRGVGERLEPIDLVPDLAWLLVRLPFGVSTAEVYREAGGRLTLQREGSSIAALLGPSGVAASPVNDLESVVTDRHPEIRLARRALEDVGAKVTGMSGSGPTVYGYFESLEAARAAADRADLPDGARTIVVTSPGSANRDWGWGVAKR